MIFNPYIDGEIEIVTRDIVGMSRALISHILLEFLGSYLSTKVEAIASCGLLLLARSTLGIYNKKLWLTAHVLTGSMSSQRDPDTCFHVIHKILNPRWHSINQLCNFRITPLVNIYLPKVSLN